MLKAEAEHLLLNNLMPQLNLVNIPILVMKMNLYVTSNLTTEAKDRIDVNLEQ